ncbi:hypothetical protein [Kitasatospora sp. P5_F3]
MPIACLPLPCAAGGGSWSLPLDLRFLPWKAGLLFVVQCVLPGENARLVLGCVYLVLALALLTRCSRELVPTARALGGRIEGEPH